ncbi:Uncharacterized protein APZ42_000886 [Daphnia magna]|uniref:Uncharacterized protein n=1 Tax=Daphnia magna TaxID=35525 RepID=A0A164JBA2_9CRUS|nr:Uncharacterized protein APZ42_000886 [Daphnia magna]
MCFIGVGVTRIITLFNGNKGFKEVNALEVKWNKENNLFTDVSPTVKSIEFSVCEKAGLRVK